MNENQLSFGNFGTLSEAPDNASEGASSEAAAKTSPRKVSKTSSLKAPDKNVVVSSNPKPSVTVENEAPVQVPNEPRIFSVSEINRAIRETVEGGFAIVWLKGEISNFKPHGSGHFYFSLKDSKAQINAVMFRGFNAQLKFRPEDGMEVLVRGRITVYEPRGQYQIFCEVMEPVGLGALQIAFEQLKAKLKAEGLFDVSRKRKLPSLPRRVVIVTSPTGAAIRDMLNVLSRRFKSLEITIVPASVQGVQAPGEIVRAIELANRIGNFDVMIVGRGGGSIEDLWAFNDEKVVRAIANSKIPTVSAVGHEVDFTIADFVADLRAPTPSAAAELVVKNSQDLIDRLMSLRAQIEILSLRRLEMLSERLTQYGHRLVDPKKRLADFAQRCDELEDRLVLSMGRRIERARQVVALLKQKMGTPQAHLDRSFQRRILALTRLKSLMDGRLQIKLSQSARLASVLDSLSPLKVVGRGYAIATHNGRVVTSAEKLKAGDELALRFAVGSAAVEVKSLESESNLVTKGTPRGF